jgi:UDP-N-acetylglucosamine--N-acetylmuramyl-(pentapeptide) pyrophosphoryl-undecaprenol N-acetylglucosamine transferase
MLFMAHLLGYPTLIQEQNSFPGVTTRLLARYVDRVHISFADTRKYFKHQDRVIVTGNPVRDLHVDASPEQARIAFGLQPNRRTLLVFGGSQGARVINRALGSVLPRLMAEPDLQIIWGCGKWDQEMVRQTVVGCEERVCVIDFINDMPMAYRAANVVLGRAGALTLAEINVCGLPAILIPLASAAGNHQEANAMSLQQTGSAQVILEKELDRVDLAEAILGLVNDSEKCMRMGQAARKSAFITASDDLARSVLELADRKKGDLV